MLVSWKWLSKYVDLSMDREELETRLSLSGLNHEGTEIVGGDPVIDLEVTSNRGDCLGHLGVAREIAVLYGTSVKTPEVVISESDEAVDSLLSVENQFIDACPRYTARVIKGVRVGPSPDWMVEALAAVGIASVNNVVDSTNYVTMECGQPLHAFDFAKVAGAKIVVRPGKKDEKFRAIDHKDYQLDDSTCVIADAKQADAIAGVMGGAESEVDESTTDLVIEAAVFTPLVVRRAARKLKLHSPSSYRFERKVDPVGVDWASRRVCQLIQELAGGEVAKGVIDTAPEIADRESITLRSGQVKRILGIDIDPQEITRILNELGCTADGDDSDQGISYVPPTWRHDLTREADLIEEVARIYGYDKIPEDAPIPVAPSEKRPFDVAMDRVRAVLTAAGMSEAMTPSVVTAKVDDSLSPWTDKPALQTQTQMLKGSKRLRRTLIPSLLQGRANNWATASIEANLFEISHIYLPSDAGDTLPSEQYSLGLVAGGDFFDLKGIIESLILRMGISEPAKVTPVERPGFAKGGAVELSLGDAPLGYLGVVDPKVLKQWKLPHPVVAAELSLPALLDASRLVPQQQSVSAFPSVQRDLNFVLAESVRWSEMENVVRSAVGDDLADLVYVETYRDEKKDGKGTKRLLLSVVLQKSDDTLSGDQADALIQSIVASCEKKLSAKLLS
ncbi:phenylalanine--tRNA ligase subunit beta [Planctomycetes bacterium K23_9]|uniref:Phenylalanine--tRNA ligase beta subunit n=1 Tax=Stieleria marina TaxID=1930275 RepID=A0A517NRW9_9BACT|nr:Phenylalanine--tRNA ligase beta subunit [Planctomycetes bacterium K23_9]